VTIALPTADASFGKGLSYPIRDEEWGVRRFMLREPSGTLVNVVSHRSG
jgi:hypothetical protein